MMKSFVQTAIACAVTLICSVTALTAQELKAGEPLQALPDTSSIFRNKAPNSTISGVYARNLVLKSTTIGRATIGLTVPADTVALDDPNSITCPSSPAGNCVVEATVIVQVGGTTASNRYSVCASIDTKAFTPPGNCPYVGFVPNGHYEAGTFSFAQYNVTPGVHKFRSYFATDKGGVIGNAFVKYNLYK
jgi:hypothetical protein